MAHGLEYDSYEDDDRIVMLENKAAELERRLLAVTPQGGTPHWGNLATPDAGAFPEHEAFGRHEFGYEPDPEAYPGEPVRPRAQGRTTGARPAAPAGRTETLLNHGRQRARRSPWRRLLAHWKLVAVAALALLAGLITALVSLGGSSAAWPASVVTVQAEIKQACANPDTAAEPSGLNFACDKNTQSVLWVFSLLTSGDNASYVDQSTNRKGLEPISAAQGGNIAWALNLHHPYDAGDPVDSLEVAARAINNIISGATLTSSSGKAEVEPGLEGKAANCQRYTGSANLVTQAGYPARCSSPVSGGAGQAALVTDVFKQWMGSTSSAVASEAGVLFENAGNPGNASVQAILQSLPASGN
jgi:hypothetical protein